MCKKCRQPLVTLRGRCHACGHRPSGWRAGGAASEGNAAWMSSTADAMLAAARMKLAREGGFTPPQPGTESSWAEAEEMAAN